MGRLWRLGINMNVYYSRTTNGFYVEDLNKGNLPSDAVPISYDHYKSLLLGVATGQYITSNAVGYPALEAVVVSAEQACKVERNWRNEELMRADIELYKVQDSDPKSEGSVSDWRSYRKLLRSWPENKNFPNKDFRPKSPDFKE